MKKTLNDESKYEVNAYIEVKRCVFLAPFRQNMFWRRARGLKESITQG